MSDTARPRRPGRPPAREGRATRALLLDAALELFARNGYEATSVRQIAGEVGVRDSAIYGHFTGKQAIYDALLAEVGPVSLDELERTTAELGEADPHAAIPELIARLFTLWSSRKATLFTSVILREGAGETGIRGLSGLIEHARERLEPPVRNWQQRGLLRGDVSPSQLVWELFAPLHIARFQHMRAGADSTDLAEARRVIDAHVDYFLTTNTADRRSS